MEHVPKGDLLRERYAGRKMVELFSPEHRYRIWRQLWVALAEAQHHLGLPISEAQLARIREVADRIDWERVAELERATRHDVVAHLRHFAELAGEAGGVLHLGATSAFLTDNTDLILARDALELLEGRLVAILRGFARLARREAQTPCLAYTHFQPAQLTTMGKRVTLWAQDFLWDLRELRRRKSELPFRGAKGTTGTQASFLELFSGDEQKVRELDQRLAQRFGFPRSIPVSGQTYSRKLDSQVLFLLAGIGESAHRFGTDLRLLQGVGELAEPFGEHQVGSSAMAYKRNPVLSERMCGLARRLLTDAWNGPWNAATQWLERSLDDSANRRLVLPEAFLTADAVLRLAGYLAHGIQVRSSAIQARVQRELPFMATEAILMQAVLRGGNRQELHERLRQLSLAAQEAVARGEGNPLLGWVGSDPSFRLDPQDLERLLDPAVFTGRASSQVREFLEEVLEPELAGAPEAPIEPPEI
jgi:adenylosuccinate lyase